MAKRTKMTYESRVAEAKNKIAEKPYRALNEIGKFLAKEVKAAVPRGPKRRVTKKDGTMIEIKPGRLRKGIGYWARKREKDLQVGSKTFYAPFVEEEKSFLKATVERNIPAIKEMVEATYKELNDE